MWSIFAHIEIWGKASFSPSLDVGIFRFRDLKTHTLLSSAIPGEVTVSPASGEESSREIPSLSVRPRRVFSIQLRFVRG
jgi:hypothetical protein